MYKKILSVLLLTALLLAGCADKPADADTPAHTTDTTAPADTVPETEEDSFESARAQYADRDYDGYVFRIVDRADPGTYADWQTFDVYAEGLNGEVINDAVYTRNTTMEDTMNIKITEIAKSYYEVAPAVQQAVLANTDDYDIMTDGLTAVCKLVSAGALRNLREISTLYPENPWWDTQIDTDMSMAGRSYFLTGDISVMDNYATWCYLFNKTMVRDLNLESPYTLVEEGRWTIDKHNEMAAAALRDADGDGRWTKADVYGFITENYNTLALWSGCGFRLTDKNEEDLPYYTYRDEEAITALEKVLNTQYAPFTNMGSESSVGVDPAETREDQFAEGRALLYLAGMRNITLFRSSDTDFGILPAPKYTETQDRYYSTYSPSNFTVYAMPITVADADKVGDITEAMAHLSLYTLTPAYYEKTLLGKATRDEESAPMIELILASRLYDMGAVYDWGGISAGFQNMNDPSKITSALKRKNKMADRALEQFIKTLDEEN